MRLARREAWTRRISPAVGRAFLERQVYIGMTFPFGFDLAQLLWSLLIPIGFGIAVIQIEHAAHARIFVPIVLGLTVLSWIAYEIVRCTAFAHSKDGWGLLVPRVIVLWVGLYALWKEVHPQDEESKLERPLVAFLYVGYFLSTFFSILFGLI